MKILSVETSCDDTGIAILEADNNGAFKILSNIIASQIEVHKKYGGVYPMMAKREHQKNLVPAIAEALKEAGLLKQNNRKGNKELKEIKEILSREEELGKKLIPFLNKYQKPDIDLISVTNGPGLEPCLWVGVNFAKALSYFWNIPIVPVNHIESHILVNFLNLDRTMDSSMVLRFPAVCLVASGGHTQLILMKKIGKYKILGETRDDAAGECFDKCAKILGLGYPGGPIIAKLSSEAKLPHGRLASSKKLPRPMINTKDYDFSFSGLKTAVLYADRKIKNKNKKYKIEMAAEIQQAIIDVLIKKTIKAARDYRAKTIILGGGVSANSELRKQFKNKLEKESPATEFIVPKPDLSTDNGLMVAIAGYFNRTKKGVPAKKGVPCSGSWEQIQADGNLRISD